MKAENVLLKTREEVDQCYAAFEKAKSNWNRIAKAVTPEEWKAAVDSVSDPLVRVQVACIVWWDFFSNRKATESWPHLDEYKAMWKVHHNADCNKVRKALFSIGYYKSMADCRGGKIKDEEPN